MDLLNNPMVNNALKAMTTEQINEYKRIGKYMYSHNFEDSNLNNLDDKMDESVAYVEEGIKSGLLPEDLTDDEVTLLTNVYGEKWFLRYGFKEEEVSEVGLNLVLKNEIDKAVNKQIEVIKNNKKNK